VTEVLARAVFDAVTKVHTSKRTLDDAKRTNVDLIPHMALLEAAKMEEVHVVAALKLHRCISRSNRAVSPDYEVIRADTQRTLASFVQAALKAGFILVQAALLAKNDGSTDRLIEAKRNASKPAQTVKAYVSLIRDVDMRAEMQNQLSELERRISAL